MCVHLCVCRFHPQCVGIPQPVDADTVTYRCHTCSHGHPVLNGVPMADDSSDGGEGGTWVRTLVCDFMRGCVPLFTHARDSVSCDSLVRFLCVGCALRAHYTCLCVCAHYTCLCVCAHYTCVCSLHRRSSGRLRSQRGNCCVCAGQATKAANS